MVDHLSSYPFNQKYADLPASLSIFPLSGAVVMPRSYLPLNIFEPRYLNMVEDAMRSNQLIGMIQPNDKATPQGLYSVGTCGRIVQYEETPDGRFNIVLIGLCRFRIVKEVSTTRGYRMVVPEWNAFRSDFELTDHAATPDYKHLQGLLIKYIEDNDFDAKWKSVVESADPLQIVNNTISYLPFSPQDKQYLIETCEFSEMVSATIAVLQTHQADETKH